MDQQVRSLIRSIHFDSRLTRCVRASQRDLERQLSTTTTMATRSLGVTRND